MYRVLRKHVRRGGNARDDYEDRRAISGIGRNSYHLGLRTQKTIDTLELGWETARDRPSQSSGRDFVHFALVVRSYCAESRVYPRKDDIPNGWPSPRIFLCTFILALIVGCGQSAQLTGVSITPTTVLFETIVP